MGFIFGRTDAAKNEWKETKKNFEKATGRKKPSDKFLGAFRKSSGLESAIDSIDQLSLKVWDAKTQKDYDKAKADFLKSHQKLEKQAQTYIDLLEESAKDGGDYADVKDDVFTLRDALLKQVAYIKSSMKNRNDFS